MQALKEVQTRLDAPVLPERSVWYSFYYTDRVLKILEGKSNRKTGLTQDEVATLFVHDKEAHSSTDNFRSVDGVLWHYGTIEALKTKTGLIIKNRNCCSRGFAHCTEPPLIHYRLDIGLFPHTYMTMQTLEVIDHVKQSQDERPATLVSVRDHDKTKYYLNAYDEGRPFLAELKEPCKTVAEAFQSMQPKEVRIAKQIGLTVYRQGELFFIPTDVKPDTPDIKRSYQVECVYSWFECELCGAKSEYDWHPIFCSWENAPEKQKNCKGSSANMIKFKRLGYYLTPKPLIPILNREFNKYEESNHEATRLARAHINGKYGKVYWVVQGIVRHPEHKPLKLGYKQWFIVVQNRVTRSYTTIGID